MKAGKTLERRIEALLEAKKSKPDVSREQMLEYLKTHRVLPVTLKSICELFEPPDYSNLSSKQLLDMYRERVNMHEGSKGITREFLRDATGTHDE